MGVAVAFSVCWCEVECSVQRDHIKLEPYFCVAAVNYCIAERVLKYVSQHVLGENEDKSSQGRWRLVRLQHQGPHKLRD
jgi:hypothetical protein